MKSKVKLTDGRIVEMETNPAGQVRVSDLAEDQQAACELLGVNECDVRYGWVHPDQREG